MDYIRKYWHILVGAGCVIVLGVVYLVRGSPGPAIYTAAERRVITAPTVYTDAEEPAEPEVMPDIVVHIEGAVNQPGVYTMPYGSRINDVLALAGGPTEEADLARINLAAFLEDAQQVIIPITREDGEDDFVPEQAAPAQGSGLININTADQAQLTTLPGIGPVIAGNIIAHRESHGPFATIEELRNVPRIGAVTLENLRDLVTIN